MTKVCIRVDDDWATISQNIASTVITGATKYYYEEDISTTEPGNYWKYDDNDGHIVTWTVPAV